jgi:hypothetical protein
MVARQGEVWLSTSVRVDCSEIVVSVLSLPEPWNDDWNRHCVWKLLL